MESKIKYQCKNCGWETSIREEWGDLKPKRCMNKKCNTSFLAHRDSLIINRPEKKKEAQTLAEKKKDGKPNRKSQKSVQTNEQQGSQTEKNS